ncbi:xylulokinase [Dorcoceras hygrometricum]|uniref:Xylulokinase n=1 Tax=Dorcoceras hygrometricum TaxID=472368 RepID=A0A2Z6ZTI5_9LAMI|nr:xylulokinase [Dorcoceras hygrometricum]
MPPITTSRLKDRAARARPRLMSLRSGSRPKTRAQIGSVSRRQWHIYQDPTRIRLSLFERVSNPDTSFLIGTTRSPRIAESISTEILELGEYSAGYAHLHRLASL